MANNKNRYVRDVHFFRKSCQKYQTLYDIKLAHRSTRNFKSLFLSKEGRKYYSFRKNNDIVKLIAFSYRSELKTISTIYVERWILIYVRSYWIPLFEK